jgi:hypothetical protein
VDTTGRTFWGESGNGAFETVEKGSVCILHNEKSFIGSIPAFGAFRHKFSETDFSGVFHIAPTIRAGCME